MFDELKKEQKVVCKILENAVKKEKYSHAYLFETNNYYAKDLIINIFIKKLLCPNRCLDDKNCKKCLQCYQIDHQIFPEVKHIYPDGIWIKKEQLDELQQEFSTKSIQGNKKVYIIHEAEKMNVQASNSILKFLEEPEENIIAILQTDNMYQLLDTIISRCQVISFSRIKHKSNSSLIDKIKESVNLNNNYNSLSNDELIEKISSAIDFVNNYEKKKIKILLTFQKKYLGKLKEKEDIVFFLEIILLYYMDIIQYIIKNKIEIFDSYNSNIQEIATKNTINQLNNKIQKIIKYKNLVKYNVNTNLLFDKLIIELERSEINE